MGGERLSGEVKARPLRAEITYYDGSGPVLGMCSDDRCLVGTAHYHKKSGIAQSIWPGQYMLLYLKSGQREAVDADLAEERFGPIKESGAHVGEPADGQTFIPGAIPAEEVGRLATKGVMITPVATGFTPPEAPAEPVAVDYGRARERLGPGLDTVFSLADEADGAVGQDSSTPARDYEPGIVDIDGGGPGGLEVNTIDPDGWCHATEHGSGVTECLPGCRGRDFPGQGGEIGDGREESCGSLDGQVSNSSSAASHSAEPSAESAPSTGAPGLEPPAPAPTSKDRSAEIESMANYVKFARGKLEEVRSKGDDQGETQWRDIISQHGHMLEQLKRGEEPVNPLRGSRA